MCQTWPTSTNIARVFSWSAARERDEMLELYDRKLSRTVLRRESPIAGGFSPAGDTAEQVSRQLGEQTVMTGSVSRGKSDPSRSLQMMGRRLMTPDELKSMPKGQFIVMKTGRHPMLSKLRLFLDWGITFTEPYALAQHAQREVKYAGSKELRRKILKEYGIPPGQQIVPGQERFPERQKLGMIQENV